MACRQLGGQACIEEQVCRQLGWGQVCRQLGLAWGQGLEGKWPPQSKSPQLHNLENKCRLKNVH